MSRWIPRLLLVCAASVWCCACHSKPKPPPGICFAKRAQPGAPVEPREWISLITRPVQRNGQWFAEQTCIGQPIQWTPPPTDCVVKTPPLGTPEAVPLTEASVVERMLPNDERLVWIITHRFKNGDGFGPVALVKIYARGIAVESLGPLRLRRQRVALELWQIGSGSILMAAGETCHDRKDPSTCHRAANVLVNRKHAFLDPPITFKEGRCIDVPFIELSRRADLPLDSGWNRHFEIISTLSHDDRYLVITEQVLVEDSDPDAPEAPPREVRRVDTQRFIHLENGRLITRQKPLWPKILPTVGEVEVTDESEL